MAKWLDSATYKYSAECASSYVSLHVRKSVHLCNLTIPTKKSLRYEIRNPNRKSAILNFLVIFCVIFAIFRCHTLTNSSQRFIQMNTKIGHCNLKPFVTLNCEDLEFSSGGRVRGVLSNFDVSPWKQEVVISQACYVRSTPNFTCLDKNPDLKRSKWPYSVIVIAPPAGNRKWHVLLCN